MDKFNENLEQFLTNLSKITNKDYAQHYDFKEPGDKYLQEFYNNCKKYNLPLSKYLGYMSYIEPKTNAKSKVKKI